MVRRLLRSIKNTIQRRRSSRAVFSEVYRERMWGGPEHDFFSGFGSHAEGVVGAYIDAIKPVLEKLPNARVTDFGCGDFNIGKHLRPLCGPYIACDVVPELIERNKSKFADLNVDFRCVDITSDEIPPGEIAIVRQVLQHLNNRQILNFLRGLRGYEILVLTEHVPDGPFIPNLDKPPGAGIRLHGSKPSGVVLTESPFNLKCKAISILLDLPEGDSVVKTTAYYGLAA